MLFHTLLPDCHTTELTWQSKSTFSFSFTSNDLRTDFQRHIINLYGSLLNTINEPKITHRLLRTLKPYQIQPNRNMWKRGRKCTCSCTCIAVACLSPVSIAVLMPINFSSLIATTTPDRQVSERQKIPAGVAPQYM
jgi:hypothetical protein